MQQMAETGFLGTPEWMGDRKSGPEPVRGRASGADAPRPRHEGLVFRRLAQGDLPRIEAHLKALNLADRTSRFHSPVPDGIIAAYVGRIDLARMILIGAVTAETGALVGLAEAHLDSADGPETAEISVSVDARWRRRCLGHRLVVQAVWAAFARGAAEAKFCFIPENLALVRLATALGARLDLARGEAVLSRTEAARGLIRR